MRSFNLDSLRRVGDNAEHGWPGYLLGGRVRTSTVALIVAFLALWWLYDAHRHAAQSSKSTQVPATQVVPPGFMPDPNYTWVPRSRLQQPPETVTVTQTPTTTPSPPTTTTTTTTTTTPAPLLPPIILPPPFGPPVTTPPPPPPGPPPPWAPPGPPPPWAPPGPPPP
ncbi:hypothetical protein [Candidatus Mycobacterium methanotrophicum]|uniref:Proline rich protein n=1 Tax=Candidatus Mycobacterium methanotrophicum TaxID=2943498 RepID=A0ABY4QP27_9MYCO|nr:hypothetical protein [Candidatus Mycobacterium methanotrophicum]UQX11716.1 hypothetical protein M5I08_04505 [Candidatus Mycobacterium methanotrophicum]